MRQTWRVLGLILLSLAVAAGARPPAGAAGKTVVVGITADAVILDPPQVLSATDRKYAMNMFDGLVEQELGSFKIAPALAERWEVAKDGLSYTFHLRKGVTFHDGTPFDAEAAAFSLDRVINPENPYNKFGRFIYATTRLGQIKSVEAVDKYVLRINLKAPYAPLLDYLANDGHIVSPAAIKKHEKEIGANPVGTGPFKFVRWERGKRLVMERNPNYWKGPSKIEQLILVPMPEAQARLIALRTGQVDFIEGVPPDNLADLKRDANLAVAEGLSPQVWYVVMNTKRLQPLGDVRVRRALNHAVNKEAIVKDVLKGTGTVAVGPLSPLLAPYAASARDVTVYEYDPEKAKKLLAEAGYAGGFDLTLSVPESGTGMQSPLSMATVIQANLAAVGVRAKLQNYEWGAYQKVRREGDFDMAAFSWTVGIGNPDIILYAKFHSTEHASAQHPSYNNSYFADPEVDKALEQTRVELDEAKRVALYKQIQKKITDSADHLWIDHETTLVAMNKRIRNFKIHPQIHYFWSVDAN
jgi:peptide/nickel transport system substrate-binding protein